MQESRRDNRLGWAQNHVRWNQRRWNRVLFSDESRFCVSFTDRRARIWRRPKERFADCCVIERDPYGAGSVMVWGGICGNQNTRLLVLQNNLTARRYIDDVLRPFPIWPDMVLGLRFNQIMLCPTQPGLHKTF